MKSRFVIATLGPVPDLDDDLAWQSTCERINRGMPWLLEEQHEVIYVGAGRGWHGTRTRGTLTSKSSVSLTPWFTINAGLIWVVQAIYGALSSLRNRSVVVVAPNPFQALGFAVAKVFFQRVGLVLRIQGFRPSENLLVKKSYWRYWVHSRLHAFAIRRADLLLPVADWLRQQALESGASANRIMMMPNCVPWSKVSGVTDLPPIPTVLFAGRLEREKGVDLVLEAMVSVREQVPDAIVLIAGKGSQRETLESRANSLGLRETVSFLGWLGQQELMQAYTRATVLVLPSLSEEGLPVVLMEAGLMGRPAVCSGTGGMCDLIKDGKNGFVVPRADIDQLSQAIVKLLNDLSLAKRMGLAARELAEEFVVEAERSNRRVRKAMLELAERQGQ